MLISNVKGLHILSRCASRTEAFEADNPAMTETILSQLVRQMTAFNTKLAPQAQPFCATALKPPTPPKPQQNLPKPGMVEHGW